MLAAVSKNPVIVHARVCSHICIKVNISTELPSGAEKDAVLHEKTHRQLFRDLVQGSASSPGSEKTKTTDELLLETRKKVCVGGCSFLQRA